jgi:hypothetical protein
MHYTQQINKFDSKNTTKILTLVIIIEHHNSGQKTRLKSRFSPWIGELQLPENATPVVILKRRDKRDSAKKGEFHLWRHWPHVID